MRKETVIINLANYCSLAKSVDFIRFWLDCCWIVGWRIGWRIGLSVVGIVGRNGDVGTVEDAVIHTVANGSNLNEFNRFRSFLEEFAVERCKNGLTHTTVGRIEKTGNGQTQHIPLSIFVKHTKSCLP